ncbi:MAG: hypothetical protein U1C59_07480 [Methylotenera sp.]|nr:hypothetical protein [Methylotenera sp.]
MNKSDLTKKELKKYGKFKLAIQSLNPRDEEDVDTFLIECNSWPRRVGNYLFIFLGVVLMLWGAGMFLMDGGVFSASGLFFFGALSAFSGFDGINLQKIIFPRLAAVYVTENLLGDGKVAGL